MSDWKHAIIVGASSGMGEQIARRLAAQGCRVALVARREAELRRVADAIEAAGGAALVYPHDVTCFGQVEALFQQACRDLGGLDVIFYASGVMYTPGPEEYDIERDQRTIDVGLTGAVAWLNEAALRFGRAGAGTIVGISSVAGDRGRGGMPAYAAAKAGLNAYLEALRNRVGRLGVNVVTIKPGPVDTPMVAALDKSRLPMLIAPEKAADLIIEAARAGRRVTYVPGAWRVLMAVIRAIPSPLFMRLKKLNS
jgi:NAD(P)-dependent dehydrogenase (short-subunit alcohol dehydrogenase family)